MTLLRNWPHGRLALAAAIALMIALVMMPAAALRAQGSWDAGPVQLSSPNHHLQAQFFTDRRAPSRGGGVLSYSLTYDGKPLVASSALYLNFAGEPGLGTDVNIVDPKSGAGVDDYSFIGGSSSHVHDDYNSVRFQLMEPGEPHRTFFLEARSYNDGLAFRYEIPQQTASLVGGHVLFDLREFHLESEHTEFRIAKDATAWALALPDFRSQYESEFLRVNLSALAPREPLNKTVIGLPLLMHVPGVAWVSINEADLEGNGAMYLTNPCPEFGLDCLQSTLAPIVEYPAVAVTSNLPHQSAWRIVMVGDQPGHFLESNLINDLNPPSRIKDTSWIRPGKASWDWWGGSIGPDGQSAFNTRTMKFYVDFAHDSGFPYMLVDAGWSAPGDITKLSGAVDVPGLVRYAAAKGVKIWLWLPYPLAATQMHAAFPLYEKWGVAGLKIDFVERDDQPGLEWYYAVAQLGAEHHLMLDFHGPTKPWGLSRTYPNVLGYESVLGMERSKFCARDNPPHRAALAFTRATVGPMDYTPGGFDNVTEAEFVARMIKPMVLGTRAQQLAIYVVYLAPIQMVSDSPQNYAGQAAFQFIKDVPSAWDETRVLNGYPGEFITVARRSGQDWYLGSLTDWHGRELTVPLDFLGAGHYEAQIYEDGPDADQFPKHVTIRHQNVQKGDRLTYHLATGGGCAIRFVHKPE